MRYDDRRGCTALAGLQRDDRVTAEACWRIGTIDTSPVCESTEFAYDTDREVVIEAEWESAARTETNIVLENISGTPIRIVTDHCGSQQWFDLELPHDNASLSSFCPCSCDRLFRLAVKRASRPIRSRTVKRVVFAKRAAKMLESSATSAFARGYARLYGLMDFASSRSGTLF